MTVNNQEFIAAVEYLKTSKVIKRDAEIADKLDYSKGVLSMYLNNKKQVPELFLIKFYEAFPTAKREKSSQNTTPKYNDAAIIDMGDAIIMNVPLVNQYAWASYGRGYADAEYVDALPRIPFMVDKEYKGTYIAFEVKGDSMDNGTRKGYMAGEILLCREVAQHHWQNKLHIKKWDFVIVTKTDGILIKQITKHDIETGDLTLHSLNDEYEDQIVNLRQVAKIFNVVQVSYKK